MISLRSGKEVQEPDMKKRDKQPAFSDQNETQVQSNEKTAVEEREKGSSPLELEPVAPFP